MSKCDHGITYYPGIAEKEKCCGLCKMRAESGPTKLPLREEPCNSPTLCEIITRKHTPFDKELFVNYSPEEE